MNNMAKFNKKPILIDGVKYDIVYDNIPCPNCPFCLEYCSIGGKEEANINGEDIVFNCHEIMIENGVTEYEFHYSRFKQI